MSETEKTKKKKKLRHVAFKTSVSIILSEVSQLEVDGVLHEPNVQLLHQVQLLNG